MVIHDGSLANDQLLHHLLSFFHCEVPWHASAMDLPSSQPSNLAKQNKIIVPDMVQILVTYSEINLDTPISHIEHWTVLRRLL